MYILENEDKLKICHSMKKNRFFLNIECWGPLNMKKMPFPKNFEIWPTSTHFLKLKTYP